MKKKINESAIATELREGSAHFRQGKSPIAKNPSKSSSKQGKEKKERKPTQDSTQKDTQNVTQHITQKVTQVSKVLSKLPSTNDIEALYFSLRKEQKSRINADVPQEWKRELDTIANELEVGKYELILYVIAQFLGKTKQKKSNR